MDYNEFAEAVKAKHPEYKDRDNKVLAEAMIKKFPVYENKVTFDKPLQADEQGNAPTDAQGNASGTPQQQIDFERSGFNKFSTSPTGQRIVENTGEAVGGIGTAELGLGLAKGATKLAAKAVPSLLTKLENLVGLEKIGAKGTNYAAGIRENTIKSMTKAGENPGEVGIKLGGDLAKSGAIQGSAIETWNEANKLKKASGQAVGKALDNINKEASKYGDVENPLVLEAKPALNTLFDSWQEKATATTSAAKKLAKPFREVYNGLMDAAEKQGGKLTLDNIRKVIKEVGPMTHKGAEETQQAMSELYGVLANVRDSMITTIANNAKNPALKQSLLDSNAEYSRWLRVMPDLARASGKEAVGSSSFFNHPWDSVRQTLAPAVSEILVKAGSAMKNAGKKGFPLAPENRSALDSVMSRLKHAK